MVLVSVILPVQEPRSTGDRCFDGWLAQTIPPEDYQLVVVMTGAEPELERRILRRLRPWDRCVVSGTANEWAMYNSGASAATGDLLFLSEVHCVPDSDVLEAMLEHLSTTGEAGARVLSHGDATSAMGRLEQDVYESAFRVGESDGHWQKVLVHGFAVSADLFRSAGGFDPSLLEFAPWRLSMALDEAGARLGFAPAARVAHSYTGALVPLVRHIAEFGYGHGRLLQSDPDLCHRFLPEPTEWTERSGSTRRGAREALAAVRASRRHEPAMIRLAARTVPVALAGRWGALGVAGLAVGVDVANVRLRRGPRRRRAYMDLWRSAEHFGRLLAFARHGVPVPAAVAAGVIDLVDEAAGRTIGVDRVEEWQGHRFRWSGPLLLIRLGGDGAAVGWRLRTLPLRATDASLGLRVAADGVIVDPADVHVTPDAVEVATPPGISTLAFACCPLLPREHGSPDPRALGLAVLALEPLTAESTGDVDLQRGSTARR